MFRILKKAQVIGYSSDLFFLVSTGQASILYIRAGTQLERTSEIKTSRDEQLLALPMVTLDDLYNLALAASNLHLNVAPDVTMIPKFLQTLDHSIDAPLRVYNWLIYLALQDF